jgi:tRNA A37 threonylcarbamoyladenosine dehydratase
MERHVPLAFWCGAASYRAMDTSTADIDARFAGIARLYGTAAIPHLNAAHVLVVGIGGVGAWTAEALVRSGIGHVTLIDPDDVCVSNVNRQLHALTDTIGHPKVSVLRDRLLAINPALACNAMQCFFNERNADEILDGTKFDVVVDAVDALRIKCLLIAGARRRKQWVVTVGGAGGRIDPTKIQTGDLSQSFNDPLLAQTRKKLRRDYNFPRPGKRMRVNCVFSPEEIRYPHSDGTVCNRPASDVSLRLGCESGYGAATYVTGTFGFAAAQLAIKRILHIADLRQQEDQ